MKPGSVTGSTVRLGSSTHQEVGPLAAATSRLRAPLDETAPPTSPLGAPLDETAPGTGPGRSSSAAQDVGQRVEDGGVLDGAGDGGAPTVRDLAHRLAQDLARARLRQRGH